MTDKEYVINQYKQLVATVLKKEFENFIGETKEIERFEINNVKVEAGGVYVIDISCWVKPQYTVTFIIAEKNKAPETVPKAAIEFALGNKPYSKLQNTTSFELKKY